MKRVTKTQARKVGHKLGIRFAKTKPSTRRPSLEEFRKGMAVEYEHGRSGGKQTNVTDDDPALTGRIVLAHLRERPDYYKLLEKYVERRKNPVSVLRRGPWTLTAVTVMGRFFVFLLKNRKPFASESFTNREQAVRKYQDWARMIGLE